MSRDAALRPGIWGVDLMSGSRNYSSSPSASLDFKLSQIRKHIDHESGLYTIGIKDFRDAYITMAKVAKSKKTRAVSVHSRAARRAASPSAGIDRSLENASGPEDEKLSKKFLSPHAGGVTKKKKSKPMTRQQRVRQEKGMQRAEADLDKLATKVTKSHKKAKNIKSRAVSHHRCQMRLRQIINIRPRLPGRSSTSWQEAHLGKRRSQSCKKT